MEILSSWNDKTQQTSNQFIKEKHENVFFNVRQYIKQIVLEIINIIANIKKEGHLFHDLLLTKYLFW